MSSVNFLNSSLHRPLKSGSKYNKYFSQTSCKSSFVGNGVTSYGLQKMKEVTLKYLSQTEKIAKVLEKDSIPATILNIKQFLYDHIQYSADGWDQQLRSPNCSWQSRKTGIDCKSYSIFAMSILINLKIKNIKFRKITQPISPEQWSHVYVVVKHNNKELIIDATVPYNYEVAKVKQEDLPIMEKELPYSVLNAAQPAGSVVVSRKTYEIATALDNFQDYLDELEQKGVSTQITNAIWQDVKSYLEKGKEPHLEVAQNYIKIQGKTYNFGLALNGVPGLGFVSSKGLNAALNLDSILGSVKGLISNLFGRDHEKEALERNVNPLINFIQENLNKATDANLHTVLTQSDEHINAYIAHQTYVVKAVDSKFAKASLPHLRTFLEEFRKQFSDFGYTTENGVNGTSYRSFWDSNPNDKLVHADKTPYTYRKYYPAANTNQNTTFNTVDTGSSSSSNNVLNSLVQLANGLFLNPSTGQTLTQDQVTQMSVAQTQQNTSTSSATTTGMSTTTKVAIGGGIALLLGIGLYVAKQKNII